MTAKGPVERKDGKIEQAELPFSSKEGSEVPPGEIGWRLIDNQRAKEEMIPWLTSIGVSHEAAARLLRLNLEDSEKEKN